MIESIQRAVEPRRWESVTCQRLYTNGPQSHYFRVQPATRDRTSGPLLSRVDQLRAALDLQLAQDEQECQITDTLVPGIPSKTEVSPWLELTQWTSYLGNLPWIPLVSLASLPDAIHEPILDEICRSVDRVVTAAHASITNGRVNVFDQTRITSFIPQSLNRTLPLLINLEKSTYHRYKGVWKRLLCFLARTASPEQPLALRHRLTTAQLTSLDRLINQIQDSLKAPAHAESADGQGLTAFHERVDDACLRVCISLLDHDLRGDLYESVVVGFFAVLGVDVHKQILMDAYRYTPNLSAFVKIAQMLVLQEAVRASERGEVDHPADLLDPMRE